MGMCIGRYKRLTDTFLRCTPDSSRRRTITLGLGLLADRLVARDMVEKLDNRTSQHLDLDIAEFADSLQVLRFGAALLHCDDAAHHNE